MNTLIKHILIGAAFALATPVAVIALGTASAQSAQAATINCGALQCNVSSSAQATNSYRPDLEPVKNPSTGGGGGGTAAPSPYTYSKDSCSTFLPVGGGQSSHSYPVIDSSSYNCYLSRGSGFGGGSGFAPYCPPLADRAANGAVYKWFVGDDGEATLISYSCAYPTDAYAPILRQKGTGVFQISGDVQFKLAGSAADAQLYNGNGLVTDSGHKETGFNAANPLASPQNLDLSVSLKTGLNADGTPKYGFYKQQWDIRQVRCTEYGYPAVFGIPSTWQCGAIEHLRTVEPFTYACNFNPALKFGIDTNGIFKPSLCNPNWACDYSTGIAVNGVTDGLEVMRNGEHIPVTHNNGNAPTISGSGAINARAWKYMDSVNAGSTPYNGANDNDAKQYFKKFNKTDAPEKFGVWLPVTNNSQNQSVAFYWAGDANKPWSFQRKYSFTADFIVNTQTATGAGTQTRPVTDFVDCGPIAQSAKVSVLRGVNN
jgi:hypothetical protein